MNQYMLLTTKDIDENALYFGVTKKNLERLLDRLGGSTSKMWVQFDR